MNKLCSFLNPILHNPNPVYVNLFGVLGMYYLANLSLSSLMWIKKHFLTFTQDLKSKYGDGWVIITGGSDGIGYSFAEQFLNQNYKVCLISRSQDKLEKAVASLECKYPSATIKHLVYDFDKMYNDSDIAELQSLINQLSGDISILVNNVGVVTRGSLLDYQNVEIHSMLNVNIMASVFLTKLVLPRMLKKEKKSLILGSGSIAGSFRFPYRSIYASTKTFLECFLEITEKEYKEKIDCTYLEIGPVETNMNRGKLPFTISSEDLTRSSMKLIGRYTSTTGHVYHELMSVMFWKMPCFLRERYRWKLAGYNIRVEKDLMIGSDHDNMGQGNMNTIIP